MTSTLTVDRYSAGGNQWDGCDITDPNQDDCSTAMSEDDFNVPGVRAYNIRFLLITRISGQAPKLSISTRPASATGRTQENRLPTSFDAQAVLTIDGSTTFAFADAERDEPTSGGQGGGGGGVVTYRWTSPGISWSDNQQVSISISLGQLTVTPGDKRLSVSWVTAGDTYELQYKETDAPDQEDRVTGADPARGWINHVQRLGSHSYVTDLKEKTAVIMGPVVGNTPMGLKPGTSYDVRLRATTGGTVGSWSAVAQATTLGTKPATETTTEPTRGPSRRVELLKEQTIWTATLTVDEDSGQFGCNDTIVEIADCSNALTSNSFTHLGTAHTVGSITLQSPNLNVNFPGGNARGLRRLTLHLDGKPFPLANGTILNTLVLLSVPGLTWTDGQQVQVRLTAREWTGVEFSSAGFVPSPEWWVHDLLVPEGGSASFGIKLTKQPTANVTVTLWKNTTPGLVHGDVNAATVSPATLTFTSTNWSQAQTVTVTGVADADADHEHLWIRAVISSTDTDYSTPDFHESVFVTVSDDGGAVQVGAWPAIGREAGNGQTSNVPVTVWLSRAASGTVSVRYATANGTATAGSDYTAVNGTLTFAAGETRKTVQVPIRDDNVEDSGDVFYLVLSNPTGASLEPSYTRAAVQILNDEAHLDGLSVEGAPGAGGPWTKLDLGAFAAETTAYALTVPHGTTHARLVPATADEDMTVKAGSGSNLTRVRSGQSGPAVALAVGANVLVVRTTAGTGVEKTYEVTVTREASQQPKPALSDFVNGYDANGNGLIDLLEYAQAGQDYGNKRITFEQFTEVKDAWSAGEAHAAQIKELANRPPTVQTAFDDVTLDGSGDSRRISTSGRFSDPDGQTITMIEAASSAQSVASVAMASDDSSLTVTARSRGTATITVTAHDGHNGRVSDTFTVTVKAAPTVASPIADIGELAIGTDQDVTLTSVFSDADNDTLTLSATSSATAVATVSVAADGSRLTVTGVAEGAATITVTARDSDGNSVSDAFDVTVPAANRAPTVASAIGDATIVNTSGTKRVSLSGVFTDADADSLTITAKSSAAGVATVSVAADSSSLTVTAKSRGTATITVTASDGTDQVTDTFTVTVKAAPTVASAISDISSLAIGTDQDVTLTSVFSDADNDTLTLSAASSATAVATVSVASDGSKLTVTGVAAGTATITVSARDPDGNSVSDAFDVTVPAANKPPTVASAISDATIFNTSGTKQVSLAGVFTDADADSLTVTAKSSAAGVATVSVAADYSSLTVTAKSRGTATITVTASDGTAEVSDTFTVTVKAAPTVASAIADISELAAGASQQISLSGVFSDADGDSLTLNAVSSSNAVVTVIAQLDPATASATAITVTGVAEGTATITVTARDSDGNSVSDAFEVTVPAADSPQELSTVPGPVIDLALTVNGDKVVVSWTAPELGSAPKGYIVHLKPEGGETGSGKTKRPKAKKTKVTYNKLEAGVTYNVWVRAQNESGKGDRVYATITVPAAEPEPVEAQ